MSKLYNHAYVNINTVSSILQLPVFISICKLFVFNPEGYRNRIHTLRKTRLFVGIN